MTQIVLTPEQSAMLHGATAPVVVIDTDGRQFSVSPTPSAWSAAELAEMEARIDSDEPRIPSSEVMARLRALENRA